MSYNQSEESTDDEVNEYKSILASLIEPGSKKALKVIEKKERKRKEKEKKKKGKAKKKKSKIQDGTKSFQKLMKGKGSSEKKKREAWVSSHVGKKKKAAQPSSYVDTRTSSTTTHLKKHAMDDSTYSKFEGMYSMLSKDDIKRVGASRFDPADYEDDYDDDGDEEEAPGKEEESDSSSEDTASSHSSDSDDSASDKDFLNGFGDSSDDDDSSEHRINPDVSNKTYNDLFHFGIREADVNSMSREKILRALVRSLEHASALKAEVANLREGEAKLQDRLERQVGIANRALNDVVDYKASTIAMAERIKRLTSSASSTTDVAPVAEIDEEEDVGLDDLDFI